MPASLSGKPYVALSWETLIFSVWRHCFAFFPGGQDRRADSPLPVARPSGAFATLTRLFPLSCGKVSPLGKKASRLAKRKNSAFPRCCLLPFYFEVAREHDCLRSRPQALCGRRGPGAQALCDLLWKPRFSGSDLSGCSQRQFTPDNATNALPAKRRRLRASSVDALPANAERHAR